MASPSLDGHEFGWTPGDGDGQGGLACSDVWFHKSRTWLSNWTELNARLEIIPPDQSAIVFLFMLSSDAILCHLLNLLQITYCTTLHDLVKDVIIVGHSFAAHYLQDSWHVCCVCLQWTHECSLVWHYHVGFTLKSLWKVDYLTGPRSPVIGSKHLA